MSSDNTGDGAQAPTFLAGIEFLTGEDPNAGAFLLVVAMVTIMFVAVFQFLLPDPVSNLLTGLVLVVAVISFIIGAILDSLGYFDIPADRP